MEPRTSDVGSDRSTNWATTTAHLHKASTIVNYEHRVVNMSNFLVSTTPVVIYDRRVFIR